MATLSPLRVRTREIPDDDPRYHRPLLDLLPDRSAMSWVRDGSGLVGWGVAARFDTAGPDRFAETDTYWHELCARMDVDDEVRLPGTGPVAFTSLAFGDQPGDSVLLVPRVVIGERDGVRWITTVGEDAVNEGAADGNAADEPVLPVHGPGTVRYGDGRLPATGYRDVVAEAVRTLANGGEVRKVVLAHDLLAETSEPLDPRFLLDNLARRYPSCWTFAVDGLVGATPELLLERTGHRVRSHVLAGTAWPRPGVSADELAAGLLDSAKDRAEHAFATESVAAELRPFCGELAVPAQPEVLRLRNVLHLASLISGELHQHAASNGVAALLRLASALHPTAAVGGTPTAEAVELIEKLEPMDRGRYTGPVGWVDGAGNGALGLALRCAQIEHQPGVPDGGSRVRLFAGGGIVTGSDPDQEVAEAAAKLRPIREALEGDA